MLEQEEEKVEEKAADQSEAHVASRAVEAVAGSHWNDEYGPLGYGSFNCVCCNAWLLLLLLPTLFLLLVAPGLELEHGSTLTRAALALFGLCALFFCLVSNTNPGVAPRTTPYIVGGREQGFEHPGEAYSYCQDSNRYVRGFDHFCDFVGNDIGEGNMPYFVGFLLSLASFATFLTACCVLSVYEMAAPPGPTLTLEHDPLKMTIALLLLVIVFFCFRGCARSEACEGVLPLILLMPGAVAGAWLLALVTATLVVMPLVTDMWSDVRRSHNPAALFLILPYLAFAVLFFGMAAHWVRLLCAGLSQKLWLRSRGYRRQRNRASQSGDALV